MEEKWLPAEHTLTFRVELDPIEAKVSAGGREFGVRKVRLRYRLDGDEWAEPGVILWTSGPGYLRREQLDEVPGWLLDIEARAQPANP